MPLESSAHAAAMGAAAGGCVDAAAIATATAMVISAVRMMHHAAPFANKTLCCVGHAATGIGANIIGIGAALQLIAGADRPIHAQGHH